MINLRFLLGLYPSTEKIEAKENAIINEYNELEAYVKSEELNRFIEYRKEIESVEFETKKQDLKKLVYDNSVPAQKEKLYNQLKNSKRITNYYKVLNSSDYKSYTELKDSDYLKEYQNHDTIVNSENFKKAKESLKKLTYETSFEVKKENEFIQLSKSTEIKNYFKVLSTEDYKLYSLLHDTHDLNHYIELKKYFEEHSAKPAKKQEGADPEHEAKIKEFHILKKDQRFIQYFKFIQSKDFAIFQSTINSKTIDKYQELKKYIDSNEFKKQKEYLKLSFQKKWEKTDEYGHEVAYKKLSGDPRITRYKKFIASPEFNMFKEVEQRGEIAQYEELEGYVKSKEFEDEKKYLKLKFEDKWALTEESKHEQEFKRVIKSDKYKWYLKASMSKKFDEVKKWKVTFEENFDNKLDRDKWLTRFFWGDNFLQEGYSLSEDLHLLTDGANISINNSVLKIETRKEKVEGKSWNPLFGFMPREFEYTSGIVNTGRSFRQKYGKFRAKIKVNPSEDIHSNFWLAGSQAIPHIDIVKYSKNKYYIANFWRNTTGNEINKNINSLSADKLSKGFFIYELEWNHEALIWRINDLEIKRVNTGIPDEEMYIQFSAGLQELKNNNQFPSSMEIDWVKCYQVIKKF